MKDDKLVKSKAALAPGTMNPAAGEPWEEMPLHRAGGVPYRKLFRWGWSVVSAARGWFFFGTILPMFRQLLEKYNIQVLATLITGLGGTAAMTGGFLAPFLPDQPRAAAIIFAFLTLFLILLGFLDRLTLTWSNNLMAVRLQQRLHDKLLDLGPTYHHSHDLGETMLIVTRFSSPTQILLRDLISFPVVRGVGLITAIIFLANSFSMMGDPPLWIQRTLLATIFILPIGGWWLSLKLRVAFEKVRDSEMALANEFSNSAALPLEVQLMGAEPQRSQAFGNRLKTLIRYTMAAFLRNEWAFQFQINTPVILQAIFLIYGVFYALQSGNPAAPGAILGIYYFVPQAVNPLQELIQFFAGLQSSWPQVEKVVEILEMAPEVQDKPGAAAFVPGEGALEVEHLDFAYTPHGPKIINDLSYSFTPGKVTAIVALAYTVRDRLLHNWVTTLRTIDDHTRVVSYLSAEFLIGPQLGNNLISLGIWDQVREALSLQGLNFEELLDQEGEPGLGNGGLGRLAACYLDSLATLEVPAIGYGIRYEFGIFDQEIRDGWQVEITDKWLELGNPWEICRPEIAYRVGWKGSTETYTVAGGHQRRRWVPGSVVRGEAYDYPVQGYGGKTANLLRLWKAEAVESFDFQDFNVGDYYGAVHEKVTSETVTKVLYPNDEPEVGKRLRLGQQYFLVSCSLQDMIRIHLLRHENLDNFHKTFAIQLNDTHPSIAVAELMRLLVDEHLLSWEPAWEITRQTLAYTNHTLLPEALEKWPRSLFGEVLPRHLEIITEINHRFLDEVRLQYSLDEDRVRRLSILEEDGVQFVRMANLACVGSHAINGVAALHTELLKQTVLKDFHYLWPEKFLNITNGVTPRRFMTLSNPALSELITRKIGAGWVTHLEELKGLEEFAEDREFHQDWRRVKLENKTRLAAIIKDRTGVAVNPGSLFDVQVKRIHEYKRQHLNVLHIISLYNRLKHQPGLDLTPRTFIFGGKAAPGYTMAKLIIKLINSVAEVVNKDPDIKDRLKVVFFPDFNVKNGQLLYPAADLSEQISTAGKEASGTGNMKFAMNGALTIGTLDGANVEIREEVGPENFFLFGLNAEEAADLKAGSYKPREYYEHHKELREAIDSISSGYFSHGDTHLFQPLVASLLDRDEYLLLADYRSFVDKQDEVGHIFRDEKRWTRMSILNTARMGKFSSDRAIREYCEKIWRVEPL